MVGLGDMVSAAFPHRAIAPHARSILVRVYCLVPGTPPPPFVRKILKTKDLFSGLCI
jgi:hypothetical protein